ncbi:hypothetical protein GCM10011487_65030 [Steroidobacter agaridevorans]|uniref:Uncharacterized protein n=1 Tax=Steroidobacter agaridevorans TaxID=2695856 RepID=A0A829YNW4_9GAMM|nr:hypothetical protein [Steroidobacter agaridevorans]GFE84503.1 hypothetical protein GCM10011487_65030 [Steroidobacter agaridevorans]GFE90902.1 hypothetical protein GCM10011488_58560 [Steroidobacter agaridevorans]
MQVDAGEPLIDQLRDAAIRWRHDDSVESARIMHMEPAETARKAAVTERFCALLPLVAGWRQGLNGSCQEG